MSSTGVKSPQTAGLGCVQRAQGVPLLGHPCFWVEVITSTYSSMISESHPRAFVSVKRPQKLAKYQAREGIFTKLYVMSSAKTMAPAAWWATYGKHLPHLTSVARCVLAQPICASAAERNWSVYSAIKTSARSRMGHTVADKLVYCHEALHLKATLPRLIAAK